jgi:hypothetical protein
VSETDKRLRERLIASGQLRPNTKELDPIQLNPGAVVFRIFDSTTFMYAAYARNRGLGALS